MSNPNRQGWLKGNEPLKEEDDFARHAARGRQELGSEAEARELMNELDGMFAARFGAPETATESRSESLDSLSEISGSAAGAKEVPLKGKEGAKVRHLGKYFAAAAAILLLIAAGSWWISQQNAVSPEQLYAEAFTPYANDLSERTMGGGEPATATDLDEALLAYDRRNYAAAAEGFGRYLAAPPTSPAPAAEPEKIQLYYGISLLANNQPEAAITELEALMNDPATGPPAAWYRALAQLRLGRGAEARAALTAVAEDKNSAFRNKAVALLRSIPSDF
jgi:hypothetical protein